LNNTPKQFILKEPIQVTQIPQWCSKNQSKALGTEGTACRPLNETGSATYDAISSVLLTVLQFILLVNTPPRANTSISNKIKNI